MNALVIPKVPKPILDASAKGELVVFIGAGVSRIIGCPSWDALAIKFLDLILKHKKINFFEYERLKRIPDPRKLITICKKILEEENIPLPDLSDFLRGDEGKIKQYKIYEHLYGFNAIYLTTNYDKHLDKVALESSVNPVPIVERVEGDDSSPQPEVEKKVFYVKNDLLPANLNMGSVVHLHGSLNDQSNLVMTLIDYIKHYSDDSEPTVLLEKVFRSKTVLFVGYGLEEYEILEFLVHKSKIQNRETKHFMLQPIYREEVKLIRLYGKYYAELGIELIPYLITANGYPQLASVLKAWSIEIGPIAKPPRFLDRREEIDEVLK